MDADSIEGQLQDEPVYLWPCNLQTFNFWRDMSTQWRVGVNGRTGLDYAAVLACLKADRTIRPKDRDAVFRGVRVMELACLDEWAQAADK